VVLVAAGLGVAFALSAFEDEAPPPTTSAAIEATSVAPSASLTSTTFEPATSAGDAPLCVAYEEFQTTTQRSSPG